MAREMDKTYGFGGQMASIPISYSVQSPRRLLAEDARVIELIDQDTKWWNSPLINTIFNVEEARTIF